MYAAPASTIGSVILNSRRPGHGWSQITECSGDFILTPQQCIQKNGSREQNHAPFRGDLSSLWQDLIQSPFVKNLRALSSAIPEIWMGQQNLQEALLSQRDCAMYLSVEILQLQNIAMVWHYLHDPMFSRFYTITECDRHTHTDRRTDTRLRQLAV